MVAPRSRSILALVQAILLVLALGTGLVFAAWMLGVNGLGLVGGSELPAQFRTSDSNAVPSEAVFVRGKAGLATVIAANHETGGIPSGVIRPGDGTSEFYGNEAFLSFWALTRTQHAAWVAVRALPALGLALVWWLLFRVVRDVRRGAGFTQVVARRMWLIGLLVLIGMPVLQFARWRVADWLVDSSTAARITAAPPMHLDVWPFAVGLVVLVLAWCWGDASRMREDLEGLV